MLRRHSQIALAGTIHFVTTVTRIRGSWFVEATLCGLILRIFEHCRAKNNLTCLGYVLMPDHIHILLHQGEDGSMVSKCMAEFKKVTSAKIKIPDFHGVRL